MPYFRFDLDYNNKEDYIHNSYHIHFGYLTKKRFSLFNYPLPKTFIEFLLFLKFGCPTNFKMKGFLKKNLCQLKENFNHLFDFNL